MAEDVQWLLLEFQTYKQANSIIHGHKNEILPSATHQASGIHLMLIAGREASSINPDKHWKSASSLTCCSASSIGISAVWFCGSQNIQEEAVFGFFRVHGRYLRNIEVWMRQF